MADNLVVVGLILIFRDEIRSAGKSDLIDILLNLVRSHADAVIDEFQSLLLRIHDHGNPGLIVFRQGILAHHIQLFQLRDGVAAVGNQLPVEDIVVGIEPFLDNGKNIFAVNR